MLLLILFIILPASLGELCETIHEKDECLGKCFGACFWCEGKNVTECLSEDTKEVCIFKDGQLTEGGTSDDCEHQQTQMVTIILCAIVIPFGLGTCCLLIYLGYDCKKNKCYEV
jgi:hypothetical protein